MTKINTVKQFISHNQLYVVLWSLFTLIGVARALQHFFIVDAYEPVQFGLWWHIPFNLFLWWSWMLFVPLIRSTIESPHYNNKNFYFTLLLYFIFPLIFVAVRQTIASLIIAFVLKGYSDFFTQLYRRFLANIWMWLDFAAYYAIIFGIRFEKIRATYHEQEIKNVQLQNQLLQTQLRVLESQIHPHFLFNTLNTLSTMLLSKENSEALRMLNLLKKFLHKTLGQNIHQQITLQEELECINDYLEIEQVRFNDKLSIFSEVDSASLNAAVPNLLLQPIVENAIYHGIAKKVSDGKITINSKIIGEMLEISIEDNGQGFTEIPPLKTGVGLKVTQERLARFFGNSYELRLDKMQSGGAKVTLVMPFLPIGSAL